MSIQKSIIIVLLFVFPVLLSSMLMPKTSGGHPGTTGASGEETCAKSGCHNAPVSAGTGINTLIYPMSDSTYIPGETYTLVVEVQKTGIEKFGFELVALKDSDDTNTGELIVVNSDRTHLISATINSKERIYITHSTNGTPATSSGYNSWEFQWKAPEGNVGNITFHYATNCTDNDGTNKGDEVYLSSFQIKPKTSSIHEFIDMNSISILYQKETNTILINYMLKKLSGIQFQLFDLQGKEILSTTSASSNTGFISEKIELNQSISSGVYHFSIKADNGNFTKKIML